MKYRFKSDVSAFDCWKSTMYHTYHSIVGVCNLVFTFAMFVLAFVFFGKVKPLETGLIILGCCWFTVIQPIGIYLKYRSSISKIPQDMELGFDDFGMHITTGGQSERIAWKKLARIAIEPNMIIIYSDAKRGYMLSNRSMGQQRTAFINYMKQRCQK